MPAAVPPAPSTPAAGGEARAGARETAGALLLGLAACAFFARALAFPPLELGDGALAGGGPAFLARLAALLFHGASTALAFLVLRAFGIGADVSALVAALSAVHPLQVEPVLWLVGRGTSAAAWPFLLALALVALRARARPRSALLACALLLCASRFLALGPAMAAEERLSLAQRLLHVPVALGGLASLWAWPARLTLFHEPPRPDGASGAALLAGWALLGLVLLAAWRARRWSPAVSCGAVAFLLSGFLAALWPAGSGLFAESDAYLAGSALALCAVLLPRAFVPGTSLRISVATLVVLAAGARSWIRIGDWRSGETLLESALAVEPASPRAHDQLGLLWRAQGRLSAAAAAHERALALRPADALAALHRGEVELLRGLVPGQEEHLGEAREWLLRSLALRASARAHERLAEIHLRADDARGARESAERALALDPGSTRAHGFLGRAALALGDLAGARAAFERETELDPREPEGWCGLGKALLRLEEPAGAARALERALELEPDHWDALATLAYLEELQGDAAAAEARYRRSVGIHPDLGNLDGIFHLGDLLAGSGREEEALRLLERAIELRPRPPHVRALLACTRLHLARAELDRAQEHVAAVLEFNPEQPEARELLRLLEQAERDPERDR